MNQGPDRDEQPPPMGRGALWVIAGTLIIGASGYVFVALVGRGRFDPGIAAALSSTYLLISILGPGVFVATEQATSRTVSAAMARDVSPIGDIKRLAALTAVISAATLVVLAAAAPTLLDRVLRGEVGLILALAVSVVGSAWVYVIRGLAGGRRRFRRYAATLLVDGVVRLVGCAGLVVLDVRDPVPYAMALSAGPLFAALVTARGVLPQEPPGGTTDNGGSESVGRGVAAVLAASLISMLLANLSPVVVTAELPGAPVLAFGFAAAVVLTRIPLLLMGPVQALVLPRLAAAASIGRLDRFRADLLQGLLLVGALGSVALTGVALLGRWAIRLMLGTETDTTGTGALVLLSCSALIMMSIQLLQPALIALHRHRELVIGWVLGAAAFGVALLLPMDPISKALLAQLAGPASTLAFHGAIVAAALRARSDQAVTRR